MMDHLEANLKLKATPAAMVDDIRAVRVAFHVPCIAWRRRFSDVSERGSQVCANISAKLHHAGPETQSQRRMDELGTPRVGQLHLEEFPLQPSFEVDFTRNVDV